MTEPTVGRVFRAYAVAVMAAGAASLLNLVLSVPLLPLTSHVDTFDGPGTISEPTAWFGFAVVVGAFWVALEWWLPRKWLLQALVMAGLTSLIGFGYLIGDPTGASTFGLKMQGLVLIAPIGLVLPAAAGYVDRVFATVRWYWMALIVVILAAQSLFAVAAFARRVGNVPVVYPMVTGLLFSALTVIRWSRSGEEARASDSVRRLATSLVAATAAVGLATGLLTV